MPRAVRLTPTQRRHLADLDAEVVNYRRTRPRHGAPYPDALCAALVQVLLAGVPASTVAQRVQLPDGSVRKVALRAGLRAVSGVYKRVV